MSRTIEPVKTMLDVAAYMSDDDGWDTECEAYETLRACRADAVEQIKMLREALESLIRECGEFAPPSCLRNRDRSLPSQVCIAAEVERARASLKETKP